MPKNLMIYDQTALDLYVSQIRNMSEGDTIWSESLNLLDVDTMKDNSQSSNESTTNSSEEDYPPMIVNQSRDP